MSNNRICPDCKNELEESANICDRCGYIFSAQSETRFPAKGGATNALSPSEDFPPEFFAEPEEKLAVVCAACGYENTPGETFCQSCGVQLPPVRSTPPPLPKPVEWTLARQEGLDVKPGAAVKKPGPVRRRLVVVGQGDEILLSERSASFLLGRSDPTLDNYPDVDLTRFDGDRRGISRRHARIIITPEGTFIEDLNSTNFTFVNRFRLQPGKKYILNDGDEIRLGLLVLEYYT